MYSRHCAESESEALIETSRAGPARARLGKREYYVCMCGIDTITLPSLLFVLRDRAALLPFTTYFRGRQNRACRAAIAVS